MRLVAITVLVGCQLPHTMIVKQIPYTQVFTMVTIRLVYACVCVCVIVTKDTVWFTVGVVSPVEVQAHKKHNEMRDHKRYTQPK